MLLVASILSGSFYWNDQLSFGVNLPLGFPYCTGVSDAPDRGVYVLLSKGAKCPDLAKESLFDYVERKEVPSIAVIAWYNMAETLNDSSDLAKAYCPKNSSIYKKTMSYGDIHYCFFSKKHNEYLQSFVLLHKDEKSMASVVVEFDLINKKMEHTKKYWNTVGSLVATLSRRKVSK